MLTVASPCPHKVHCIENSYGGEERRGEEGRGGKGRGGEGRRGEERRGEGRRGEGRRGEGRRLSAMPTQTEYNPGVYDAVIYT